MQSLPTDSTERTRLESTLREAFDLTLEIEREIAMLRLMRREADRALRRRRSTPQDFAEHRAAVEKQVARVRDAAARARP